MKVVLRLCVVGLLASSVLAVNAGAATVKTITTAQISAETLAAAPSCLHYAIQGQCFWLQCGLGGCSVDTTLKVSEYLPDATVSVFNKPSTDPWFLTRTTLDKAALALAKAQTSLLSGDSYGFGNASDVNNHHTEDGRLKEAVMLGNPVAELFHPPLFIPTLSTPLIPYYQSMLDAASWRSGLTELFYPASVIPGDQDIGQFPYNVWGSLYPRTGFVDTSNDAKAAAIVAERVASIVMQSGQPHVYVPLQSGSCGQSCTAYSEAVNDPNTIQWQRVYPLPQTQCESFGSDHLAHLAPWGSAATAAGGGNYVWVMWRHYQGCIQDGGTYLGSD